VCLFDILRGYTEWTLVSAVPLYGESQSIIGAASVFVDINEEKQTEPTLRWFNEELEIRVEASARQVH